MNSYILSLQGERDMFNTTLQDSAKQDFGNWTHAI